MISAAQVYILLHLMRQVHLKQVLLDLNLISTEVHSEISELFEMYPCSTFYDEVVIYKSYALCTDIKGHLIILIHY